MKTCTKCGESKPVAEFHKDASKCDGLRPNCKVCGNAANAKWRTANREKANAAVAAWTAANPEKARAAVAKWKKANPENGRAAVAKWRAANPEWVRDYKAANMEAFRTYSQNRRARANGGKLSKGLSAKLFNLQRGKCACGCRQPLGDGYHLDHIMPLALGGTNTDDNMQLLTATCNMQKNSKHPIDFMQQRGFLL